MWEGKVAYAGVVFIVGQWGEGYTGWGKACGLMWRR